jgi:allantoicase
MMQTPDPSAPAFTRNAINLASAALGAKTLSVSDDFFAPAERMLNDDPAVFIPDKYDDHGKWMDGWESRRRRGPGHDMAVVRLAVAGRILGFDVDTSHFTGNYPPAVAIEGARITGDPDANTKWTHILLHSPLGPNAHHYFDCASTGIWSHVRIHIFPDGGVARLRVYGTPEFDRQAAAANETDLASALLGGRVVAVSNAHYGNLNGMIAPGRAKNMGDGWETRRLREPGNDWCIVKLAARGTLNRLIVDTAHFKGNFPESCSVLGADLGDLGDELDKMIVTSSMFWTEMVARTKLSADAVHEFKGADVADIGPVTHLRLNIFPDGGVSRFRAFGRAT